MLPVLYQDDDLVAVDKPSGLLVHRTKIAADGDSCAARLREQLGRRVFAAHRLDRGASGVLVFALNQEMASRLGEVFRARGVEKRYHAVVRGYTPDAGEIDKPLRQAPGKPYRNAVSRYATERRVELPFAVGRYATARYSLVSVETETGRSHQVRRHLCHVSHPILGDTTYGDGRHNCFAREKLGIRRLLLHGALVRFSHPQTGFPLKIESPLPAQFAEIFSCASR
jgi:tRNA pseudouridine65 synthase